MKTFASEPFLKHLFFSANGKTKPRPRRETPAEIKHDRPAGPNGLRGAHQRPRGVGRGGPAGAGAGDLDGGRRLASSVAMGPTEL